jgi:hypothetical protein
MRIPILLLLLTLGIAALAAPPAPRRATAYACWSPTALYLAFRVAEPHIQGDHTEPLGQPWLDDAVAAYLDFAPNDPAGNGVLRVVVSAAGGVTVQRQERGEWRDQPQWFDITQATTIRCGVRLLDAKDTLNQHANTDHGYQVELGLAWELLGTVPPLRTSPDAPLPSLRVAFAAYTRGNDMPACWPAMPDGIDLRDRTRWGAAVFLPSIKPLAGDDDEIAAALAPTDPVIDGDMRGLEWLTAGVVSFPLRDAPAPTPPQVPVIAAWYRLAPFSRDDIDAGVTGLLRIQPPVYPALAPANPWVTPDAPAYHLQELREVRRAGVDALGVMLPVGPVQRREANPRRVLALVTALEQLREVSGRREQATPLLFPVVRLAPPDDAAPLRLDSDDARASWQRLLRDALTDFYAAVPPQHRLLVPDAAGALRVPVVLTVPDPGGAWPLPLLDAVAAAVRSIAGRPIGWLLDGAWTLPAASPDVLTHCRWDTATGIHRGTGPLRTMCLAPGLAASRRDYVPYRDGAHYDAGWQMARAFHPALVMLRSWNDFAAGTAIAPTRVFGAQYVDATRLAALHLAGDDRGGVRLLGATVPATLATNAATPVEVTLKNALPRDLLTKDGCRLTYRLTKDGRDVLAGHVPLALPGLSTGRAGFTLPTSDGRPLPAGAYDLRLDIERQRTLLMELPFLTKTLASLHVPVTVGDGTPELIAADTPAAVGARMPAPVAFAIRNPGPTVWLPERTTLRLHWCDARGVPEAISRDLTPDALTPPGGVARFTGYAPAAPREPGNCTLVGTLTGSPAPVVTRLVPVHAVPPGAYQVLTVEMPDAMGGPTDATVSLRNAGSDAWEAGTVHLQWAWQAWDGRPLHDAHGAVPLKDTVLPGQEVTLTVAVTPPPGVGPFHCAFGLTRTAGTLLPVDDPRTHPAATVPVLVRTAGMTAVALTEAYNDIAASTDALHRADLDGRGNAFPTELCLPDAHAPACGYPTGYGIPDAPPSAAVFRFGAWRKGQVPMARAKGQRIALPAQRAAALHLAACATATNVDAVVTVCYTDGSEGRATLPLASWLDDPAGATAPAVFSTRYLRAAKGDNWLLNGTVFAYRVALDPTKTPAALVLPDTPAMCLFAATLEVTP